MVIEIPDNATNCDVIKAVFPTFPAHLTKSISVNFAEECGVGNGVVLDRYWALALYKRGDEDASSD